MRRSNRSGQFFILSAVVIALILFAVVQGLEYNKDIEPGIVQENDISAITRSLHHEINSTIALSSAGTIESNLDLYLANKQKELKQKGIVMTYTRQIAWPTVIVNTTLESQEYTISLDYP